MEGTNGGGLEETVGGGGLDTTGVELDMGLAKESKKDPPCVGWTVGVVLVGGNVKESKKLL